MSKLSLTPSEHYTQTNVRPAADTLPEIDGIVGISALQARRVHFDFSGKTLFWE
jgi:hypothetical protein